MSGRYWQILYLSKFVNKMLYENLEKERKINLKKYNYFLMTLETTSQEKCQFG